MKIRRPQTVQVRLTEKEGAILDSLSEKIYGGAGRSDVVRRCITERFNKAFPQYLQKRKVAVGVGVPDEELTDEQFCELNGGRVEKSIAGSKCVLLYPSGAKSVHMVTDRDGIAKTWKLIQSLKS